MPRGSKPGERRGGRKKGTPNKRTLLHNAFIAAVAADPNLQPLDFFLRLMHQSNLPLDTRLRAAVAALPFVHARPRPKPQIPPPQDGEVQSRVKLQRKIDANPSDLDELHLGPEFQDGGDGCDDADGPALQPGLTEPSEGLGKSEVGERHDMAEPALLQSGPGPVAQQSAAEPIVKHGAAALALAAVARVKPEGGEAQGAGTKALTPLAFLRAVMRHPDTPVHVRMKVALIIAPYLHAKPTQQGESKDEYVVDDQYGFSVEPVLAKNLWDTQNALHDLPNWWIKGEGTYEQQQEVLEKQLALAKKSLRCPETYRWEDLAKDNARLSLLSAKRKAQDLTPVEEAEELHLTARTFSHENSAEHAERERRRDRQNVLYAKWKDYSITEAEQQEFDDLRASLRDTDPDPVSWDFDWQLCLEARIRGWQSPTSEDCEKMLAAKGSSADIIRDPAKPPREGPPESEDVDFAAWLRGEVRYPAYLLHKAAYARFGKAHDIPIVPDLVVALVRDEEVVFEDELSPHYAWVLRIYDEAHSDAVLANDQLRT
jgi:hypothetical protein